MGQQLNSFLENWLPLILMIAIAAVFYLMGYHSGNRFRISRLKMRDPEVIKKEIFRMQQLILENRQQITKLHKAQVRDRDVWQIDRLKGEITLFEAKLDVLKWTVGKDH